MHYSSPRAAINSVLTQSTRQTNYPIREFYKAHKVESALNNVSKACRDKSNSNTEVDVDPIDSVAICNKILSHVECVQEFFNNHLDCLLTETMIRVLPAENSPEFKALSSCLEFGDHEIKSVITEKEVENTKRFNERVDRLNKAHGISLKHREVPQKGDVATTKTKGYTVKDKGKLERLIKALPMETFYHINTFADTEGDIGVVYGTQKDIYDLAIECGIESEGYTYFTVNLQDQDPIQIRQSHLILRDILTELLVLLKNLAQKNKSRSVVNVKNPDTHAYIGRPSTVSLLDMIAGAIEGREMKNLANIYRKNGYGSDKAIIEDGGFLAHMDNAQEMLPMIFDETDRPTLVKFMANTIALTLDSVIALQAYKRDNPDNDGYIKLTDLAKYIPQYDNAIKNKNYGVLKNLYNGLMIASLASADYKVKTDKKGNTEWRKIYLVNRITDYETNKAGNITKIKTDFTTEYKHSLDLNLGVILDGVQNIKTVESKLLATYILDRQVAQQDKTIKGEPLTVTAQTLVDKAGIINTTNTTERYNTLKKMLNALVDEGIISKWQTKRGTTNITGYNTDSQSILIYPSRTVKEGYITKQQSKAVIISEKAEQKARIKALKKYASGYTNLNILAGELCITRPELNELLAEQSPISDEIIEKIDIVI